jgi:microcystin-dependent protein
MSQYDFGTIDPYVVDGETLANMLNRWRDAIYTIHRGSARPAYIVPGMLWVDDSGGAESWVLKVFLSSAIDDSPLFVFNSQTGDIKLLIEQDAGNPPGAIIMYAGLVAPSGYLFCDGGEYSRTAYAALFAAIGIRYGSGDGVNTFNVPDMNGRSPVGRDKGKGRVTDTFLPNGDTLGATGGDQHDQTTVPINIPASVSGTLNGTAAGGGATDAPMNGIGNANSGPGNSYNFANEGHQHAWRFNVPVSVSGALAGAAAGNATTSRVTNVQPSIIVDYLIKY